MAGLLPEEKDVAHPPARRGLRGVLIALIGAMALACLCVLTVGLSRLKVSATQQQIAQQAVLNPNSATLHLGSYGDVTGWRMAGPTNYAVQDGMVIFPGTSIASSVSRLAVIPDLRLSVLVYAPDGSDLSPRIFPPTDRTWFYGNEWILYNCRPRPFDPLWWDCVLLVGGNI